MHLYTDQNAGLMPGVPDPTNLDDSWARMYRDLTSSGMSSELAMHEVRKNQLESGQYLTQTPEGNWGLRGQGGSQGGAGMSTGGGKGGVPPGYEGYMGRLFSMSPEEQMFSKLIQGYSQASPGLAGMERTLYGSDMRMPWDQGGGGLEGLFNSATGFAGGLRDWAGSSVQTPEDTQAIQTIRDLITRGQDPTSANAFRRILSEAEQGPTGLESQALRTLRGRTDPGARLQTIQDYISQVAGPEARAASQAGGMGGAKGGAFQEGLAREGSRLSLPLMQMIDQAQRELAGYEGGLGSELVNRRGQAATGLENILAGQQGRQQGFGRTLTDIMGGLENRSLGRRGLALQGMDTAGRLGGDLARLGPTLDASRMAMYAAGQEQGGLPRMMALQDYLRRQNLLTGAMTGIPVSTGSETSGRQSMTNNPSVMSSIGQIASIAGLAMMT